MTCQISTPGGRNVWGCVVLIFHSLKVLPKNHFHQKHFQESVLQQVQGQGFLNILSSWQAFGKGDRFEGDPIKSFVACLLQPRIIRSQVDDTHS